VEIDNEPGEMDIYASDARLGGKLTVVGDVTVTAGPRAGVKSVDRSYQLEIPETVEFAVQKPQRIAREMLVRCLRPIAPRLPDNACRQEAWTARWRSASRRTSSVEWRPATGRASRIAPGVTDSTAI
jgi:hypothetical protein